MTPRRIRLTVGWATQWSDFHRGPVDAELVEAAQKIYAAAERLWGRYASRPDNEPPISLFLEDLKRDWCVIHLDSARQCKLIKVSYVINVGVVSFGSPMEVTRRRIYDPVPQPSDAGKPVRLLCSVPPIG